MFVDGFNKQLGAKLPSSGAQMRARPAPDSPRGGSSGRLRPLADTSAAAAATSDTAADRLQAARPAPPRPRSHGDIPYPADVVGTSKVGRWLPRMSMDGQVTPCDGWAGGWKWDSVPLSVDKTAGAVSVLVSCQHSPLELHPGFVRREALAFLERSTSSADCSNCSPTRTVGAPIGHHPEAGHATEGQRALFQSSYTSASDSDCGTARRGWVGRAVASESVSLFVLCGRATRVPGSQSINSLPALLSTKSVSWYTKCFWVRVCVCLVDHQTGARSGALPCLLSRTRLCYAFGAMRSSWVLCKSMHNNFV
eukprot:364628-Chlamydomonas_euryale.AAC.1